MTMIDLAHLITLIAQADTNGELQKTERGKLVVEAAKRLTSEHDLFNYWPVDVDQLQREYELAEEQDMPDRLEKYDAWLAAAALGQQRGRR